MRQFAIPLLLLLLLAGPAAAADLRAGASVVDVTPPVGTPLAGYGARAGNPSRGVDDPIRSRTVVLAGGGGRVAIVSLDTVGVTEEMRKAVLARLPAEAGIHDGNLLLAATHNHAGPGGLAHRPVWWAATGAFRKGLFEATAAKVADGIAAAAADLRPATARFGRTSIRGLVKNRRDPAGPVDEGLFAVRIDGAGGPRAFLVMVSVHPTLVPATSFRFSPGWPGALGRSIRARTGADVPVLVLNGALGDQAPVSESRSPDDYGARLADRALAALRGAEPLGAAVEARVKRVTLPPSLLGDLLPETALLSEVRIGKLTLLGVPGEMNAGPGVRIRSLVEKRTGGPAWLVGLANDHLGYFADATAWREGGYESRMTFFGPRVTDVLAEAFGVPAVRERTRAEAAGIVHGRRRSRAMRRAAAALVDGAADLAPEADLPPALRVALRLLPSAKRALLLWRAAQERPRHRFLPRERVAAMEGMARGAGVPYDVVYLANLLDDPRARPLHAPASGTGDGPEVEPIAPHSRSKGYRIDRVWFRSPLPSGYAPNDRFPVEHYVPRGTAKGAMVVLPLWKGGVLLAERMMAGHLASNGCQAVVMPLPWMFQRAAPGVRSGDWTLSSDLERTDAAFRQAYADVRVVVDWLRARKDVEEGRVGVTGISLGAHVAAVAYQRDPRLKAGIFVMAGGDPASMIWNESRETRRMKRELIARGKTIEDVRRFFAPFDPAGVRGYEPFPAYPRYRGALMINARKDNVVPPPNARKLHSALGGPRIVWFDVNHYTMALRLLDVMKEGDAHLERMFR